MPAIGITGGVSTGKSTFCDCLREILPGAKFFDADAVARQLVARRGVSANSTLQNGQVFARFEKRFHFIGRSTGSARASLRRRRRTFRCGCSIEWSS